MIASHDGARTHKRKPEPHRAFYGHLDGQARLWDSQGRRVGEPFGGTATDITTLAAGRLHHQPVVALGYSDGSVLAFNPTDPTTRRTLAPEGALVSAMTINDGIAVLGYADGTIRVLDGATTEVAHLLPVRRGRVSAVAVHLHDGHLIVVAKARETARVRNGHRGVAGRLGRVDPNRRLVR